MKTEEQKMREFCRTLRNDLSTFLSRGSAPRAEFWKHTLERLNEALLPVDFTNKTPMHTHELVAKLKDYPDKEVVINCRSHNLTASVRDVIVAREPFVLIECEAVKPENQVPLKLEDKYTVAGLIKALQELPAELPVYRDIEYTIAPASEITTESGKVIIL